MKKGWNRHKFHEVVNFQPSIKLHKGESYWFIPMEDIQEKTNYVFPKRKKVFDGSSGAKFKDGDIIFSRITPCLQNGKISQAVLGENQSGFGSTEYFIFRGKEKLADQKFLFYFVTSDAFTGSAINSMVGASGRQRADKDYINNLDIILPSIVEQKKIGEILSQYDDLIVNNTKRIAVLEQMADQIFKEWFVRMRFPGHEKTKFVKGIPEGWEVKCLKKICERVTDGTHDTPQPTSEGFPLITGKNLRNGIIDFENSYFISKSDHLKISQRSGLNKGDILLSNIGTIGSLGYVDQEIEYSVKNVLIFKPKNKAQSLYLFNLFSQKSTITQLALCSSGASQQFISLSYARNMKIFDPGDLMLNEFKLKIESIVELKKKLIDQNNKLIDSRNLLLPRLISGKLSVEHLTSTHQETI